MKMIFLTNFVTPHTKAITDTLYDIFGNNFCAIETLVYKESEIPIGWRPKTRSEYIVTQKDFSEDTEKYIQLINQADTVIIGSAPIKLVKKRLKIGKLTFRYSERVYKKKCPWYQLPLRTVKYYFQIERYKNFHLLCASAFASADYAKTGTFKNRTYKWGYFPQTWEYDIDKLLSEKTTNSILWAGRLIDWKHPEIPVQIAKRLKNDGYDFQLNIIGTGDMYDEIKALIQKENLCENVHLLGSMTPEEVREHMEKTKIYLFTSDRKEGWGAVLNESMNSGCAVVSSSSIGSAPYLIDDGENGFLYDDGNINDIYEKVTYLLDNPNICNIFGEKAYHKIVDIWNAKVAVERLISISKELLDKSDSDLYNDGPCSRAEIIKDDWYSQSRKR